MIDDIVFEDDKFETETKLVVSGIIDGFSDKSDFGFVNKTYVSISGGTINEIFG